MGEWALKLLNNILEDEDVILISELVRDEMLKFIRIEELDNLLKPFKGRIIFIILSDEQFNEAKLFSRKYSLTIHDALHAVLAKDNDAILITRDKHFESISDILCVKKPEELI